VSKFKRQFLSKHTLVFIHLYCSKADFLKRPISYKYVFLKELANFREAMKIKMSVINKYILFVKYFLKKRAGQDHPTSQPA
jgi:hypothetical protein